MRVSLLLALVALPLLALLPQPATAADYTVLIGWETLIDATGPAWYSLFFYPANLTIAFGDSVTWIWNSGEVHNVVFTPGDVLLSEANPDGTFTPIAGVLGNQTHFVDPSLNFSSGIRNNNVAPITLTFIPNTGSGSFQYYCSIHSMIGFINVLPLGEAAPITPAQVNASADALVADLEVFANAEIAALQAAAPATGALVTHNALSDGSNEWSVIGGAMWMNGNTSMYARFMPSYIEINVNDTITWTIEGTDPHYVYFSITNDWPLIYANWSHNQTTPVSAEFSRESTAYNLQPTIGPTGPILSFPTATYPNPTGIVNSGIFFDPMFAGVLPFPNSYSVKFVETGTFAYQCPLHLDIGMIATVVVKPANTPLCTVANDASTCALVVTAPVSVLGDPQFVGLLGQSYQVHGIDGAVYSVISETNAQVNARFAFLTGPRSCPSVRQQWSDSEPATGIACWSHDGSYLSELGLFTPSARLFIQAGSAASGFAAVEFNGTAGTSELMYERLSSHHVTVTLGSFTLYIDNSDGFVNLATVKPLVPLKQLSSHGLLGQTHTRRGSRSGLSGVIEGEVDDYVVDGGLFAVDAMYNKFGVASQ